MDNKIKNSKSLSIEVEKHILNDGAIIEYYPNLIHSDYADELFENLMKELNWNQSKISFYGKEHNIPRLQACMADASATPSLFKNNKPILWSDNIYELRKKLEKILDFKFDYVLINLYRDGNDYISYHSDLEAVGEGKNVIAGVSLGQTRKFVMRHNQWKTKNILKKEFKLEHGSVIVMKNDSTQKYWKHTVPKSKAVNKPRINLTFRHS